MASLEVSPVMRLESARPLGIAAWHRTFLRPLQTLMTLASGEPSIPTELRVIRSGIGGNHDSMRVLSQVFGSGARRDPEEAPLFRLDDIGGELEGVINRWFGLSEVLGHSIDLWLAPQYNPSMCLEQEFLILAQSVEAYHRFSGRFRQQILDRSAHDQRIAGILNKVPAEHNTWLRDKLCHSNEPTLGERLEDAISFSGRPVSNIIPKPKVFVKRAKDTRNYYTHYSERLKAKAAAGVDMLRLCRQIHYLMLSALLLELGFIPAQIKSFLESNPKYVRESAAGPRE